MIRGFRDLRVWQQGIQLVEEIYRELRRAAVSVPSNIAEGHTREHNEGVSEPHIYGAGVLG